MIEGGEWNRKPVVTIRWGPFWLAAALTWLAIGTLVYTLWSIGW